MFGTFQKIYSLCVRRKERVLSPYDVRSMYTRVNDKCNLYTVSIFNGLWGFCVLLWWITFPGKPNKKYLFAGEGIWFSIYLEYCLFDSCISEINGQVNCNEKNCKYKVSQITVLGKAHIIYICINIFMLSKRDQRQECVVTYLNKEIL